MNTSAQRACAWSGLGMIVLFLIGFWVVAGFVPPPDPKNTAEQVTEIFRHDRNEIRTGMLITMMAAGLLIPWSAVLSAQIKRIEGRHAVLAYIQFGAGALLSLEFTYMVFFWLTAAYRADRSPGDVQLLNDMAWIPFVGLTSTGILQAAAIGIAILRDRRETPIFPRWAGYLNLWVAFLFTPGSLNVFFQEGPFAWNGLLAFWLVLGAFSTMLFANTYLLFGAIKHQEVEESNWDTVTPSDGHAASDVTTLAAELQHLRQELARVAAR